MNMHSLISFHQRRNWDLGFGALGLAADGSLLARTTPGELLWKIDINRTSAIMIESNEQFPINACEFTSQFLSELSTE